MCPRKPISVAKFPQHLIPFDADALAFLGLIPVSHLTVNYSKPELLNCLADWFKFPTR